MSARYSLTPNGNLVIPLGESECVIHSRPRYNIAPTQKAPVILAKPDGTFATPEIRWGWTVPWHQGPLINTPGETILPDPNFSERAHQRCLVPADGFYEWEKAGAARTPIRFTKPDSRPFCFAGLWDIATTHPHGQPVTEMSFLILTTIPNKSVGRFHNRMPLIVQPAHYSWWLDTEDDMFSSVLQHPDREELIATPVQPALNKPGAEGPDLIRPYRKP